MPVVIRGGAVLIHNNAVVMNPECCCEDNVPSACCPDGLPRRIRINFAPVCAAPADSIVIEWLGPDPPYNGAIWQTPLPSVCAGSPSPFGVLSAGGAYRLTATLVCIGDGEFTLGMDFYPIDCNETRTCGSLNAGGTLNCDPFGFTGTFLRYGSGLDPSLCYGCNEADVVITISAA